MKEFTIHRIIKNAERGKETVIGRYVYDVDLDKGEIIRKSQEREKIVRLPIPNWIATIDGEEWTREKQLAYCDSLHQKEQLIVQHPKTGEYIEMQVDIAGSRCDGCKLMENKICVSGCIFFDGD